MTQSSYDSIFVIVDFLTKITHFIPMVTILMTSSVVCLFIKNVFKIHGWLVVMLILSFWVYFGHNIKDMWNQN